MDIAKDIVEKYTTEEIVSYLDRLVAGVIRNYQTAIKVNQPEILFSNIGDLSQVRSVLHEMDRRNKERAALAKASEA